MRFTVTLGTNKTSQSPPSRKRTTGRSVLWPVSRTWRRRLTHGLLVVLLAACYVGLVYALSSWTSGFLHLDKPLLLAFLVLLAALLIVPVHYALRRLLDRTLQQEPVDFRQAVEDLDASMAQVIDLPEMSRLILRRITETLAVDTAALYLFDPRSGTYQLYQDRGQEALSDKPVFAETDRFIQTLRVTHGAVQRRAAASSALDDLPPEEATRIDQLQAQLFLPLATKDRLVGFISLGGRPSGADYTAAELALLSAMADRATVAIENARLFAERERRLTELAVLNEIGQAINAARSLEKTLETIYSETGRLMDTTNFYIALYDPQQQKVSFPLYVANGERRTLPPRRFGNGLTEHILRTHQPLLIAERVEEKIRALDLDVLGKPACSWLGVPILREDQAIGVIAIQSITDDSPYDIDDLNILVAIANQAAIAIENARRYEVTDQALARRLQEITVLSDFARTLATVALDPVQVAEQTLERAVETLRAQAGTLVHYDEDQQSFVPLAQLHWPADGPWQKTWHALLPDLFNPANGPTVYRSDVPEARVPSVEGAPIHILCPLIREDTPLALLHLALPQEAKPDEARRHFLRYLSDHAAIALENALLYQKQVQQSVVLDQRARHLAEILNLSIAIRANTELDQALHFVVRAVQDTLGFQIVLLSLKDEKEPRCLRRAAAAGIEPELLRRLEAEKLPIALYQKMMQPAVRVSHSYVLSPQDTDIWEAIQNHKACSQLQPLHDRPEWSDPCTVLTPLRGTADRLLGALTVSRPADGRVPGQDTIEILEIIANQAAVAIENTRLYQALREAYETKGEFLSLVAQELHVPMGTILGYAELLDQEMTNIDPHTLRGFLQVLRSNITRLDALVRDLLEISWVEADAFQLDRAPLDVSEVILDSIAAVRPKMERKGLSLKVDVPPDTGLVVTDRDRLGQILDNLLSNAYKYTPAPGSIAIATQTIRDMQEMNGSAPSNLRCPCVMITVQDTGIGISRTEQKRVFGRFFRSDHPLVREETGTGLGLYLVHLLIERLGGHVWLESEPEQGSRFFVALPLAE